MPRSQFCGKPRHVATPRLLERWFIKTIINQAFGHMHPIGGTDAPVGWPVPTLVKKVYGLRPLGEHAGLYAGGVPIEPTIPEGDITIETVIEMTPALVAGAFVIFRSKRFLIWLLDDGVRVWMLTLGRERVRPDRLVTPKARALRDASRTAPASSAVTMVAADRAAHARRITSA